MKIRTTPVLLAGFLILFCSARAQFTGNFAITDGTHPAANYGSLSTSPTLYGNWTVTGGANVPGGLNTTNAASNSIVLNATVVGTSGGNGSTAIMLSGIAATDLSVSFNFSATNVYSSGQFSDGASFLYTTNGGSTWNTIYQTTGAITGGTVSSTPVTFLVSSGQKFGFEALAGNTVSLSVAGIYGTVSNFTVSAVPEPSTYAAIFGIGALGLVVYRRRMKRTV